MSPWIRTFTGKQFHLLSPKQDQIDIMDIAHSLSQLCRFTGHTRVPIYISQHCCTVCDQLPPHLQLVGLLHDSSESFLSDISSPAKSLLPQYQEMEQRVEKAIAKRFGIQFPFGREVKQADMVALVSEMKWFMPRGRDWQNLPFTPLPRYEAWDSKRAQREFLRRFRALSHRS